jgi:hypothetical protein
MGTWGLAAFENDDASDFLYEVEDAGWSAASKAMTKVVLTFGYLEAPESQRGVAAATLVAAKLGPGTVALPEEAGRLLERLPSPPPFSRALAKLTINRVLKRSELQDLWAEGMELDDWRTETRKAVQAL